MRSWSNRGDKHIKQTVSQINALWILSPWKVKEGFKALEQNEKGLLTRKISKITLQMSPWWFSACDIITGELTDSR